MSSFTKAVILLEHDKMNMPPFYLLEFKDDGKDKACVGMLTNKERNPTRNKQNINEGAQELVKKNGKMEGGGLVGRQLGPNVCCRSFT